MSDFEQTEQLKKRFLDLAQRSYQQNLYTFSGFLGLAEQDAYHQIERELFYAGCKEWGGMEGCERTILRFGKPELLGYEQDFPIACIQIRPSAAKFAENLGHRDYLGALMNLGITRDLLGDILIREEDKTAYLFCQDTMADYIVDHLDQVRHTAVKLRIVDAQQVGTLHLKDPKPQQLQVAGCRIDAVVSKLYNVSRSQSIELFRTKKIFVNGKCCENNSYQLKNQDVVSIRGYGRFIFNGIAGETRKGKAVVNVDVY